MQWASGCCTQRPRQPMSSRTSPLCPHAHDSGATSTNSDQLSTWALLLLKKSACLTAEVLLGAHAASGSHWPWLLFQPGLHDLLGKHEVLVPTAPVSAEPRSRIRC